jgi:hypothetical protein
MTIDATGAVDLQSRKLNPLSPMFIVGLRPAHGRETVGRWADAALDRVERFVGGHSFAQRIWQHSTTDVALFEQDRVGSL